MPDIKRVSPAEWAAQQTYIEQVRAFYAEQNGETPPLACIRTFGCQQNVADSEHIGGMLSAMGFDFTDDPEQADFILFNTCAVREHAEDRVFGNVGALKTFKRNKPSLLIAICGCMVQQEHIADKLRQSYPFVGLIFGTHTLHRFPEWMARALRGGKRVIEVPTADGYVVEGMPVRREAGAKAWLPIMYGCNNFCTYCIVPYVRGRERSRDPEDVLREARELVAAGYRDITLLGQNVNSYGKGEPHGVDFPELLRRIQEIPGDFTIRFMTSHPKDATPRLFDTIAACDKVSRHFHLPFQSGSDRVLRAMNRGYTRQQYLDLIAYARRTIPGIEFTSDVIVGFPGETREDFEQTLSLIREVGFQSLFTFIFSPRVGTPAAAMDDPIPADEKRRWFKEMTDLQEDIAAQRSAALVGQCFTALIESEEDGYLQARSSDNTVIRVPGTADLVGRCAQVRVTEAKRWILLGEIVQTIS